MKHSILFTMISFLMAQASANGGSGDIGSDISARCVAASGFNESESFSLEGKGELKSLVHRIQRDTKATSEEQVLISKLLCDFEKDSAICFSSESEEKVFIMPNEGKIDVVILVNTPRIETLVKEKGFNVVETELGASVHRQYEAAACKFKL